MTKSELLQLYKRKQELETELQDVKAELRIACGRLKDNRVVLGGKPFEVKHKAFAKSVESKPADRLEVLGLSGLIVLSFNSAGLAEYMMGEEGVDEKEEWEGFVYETAHWIQRKGR